MDDGRGIFQLIGKIVGKNKNYIAICSPFMKEKKELNVYVLWLLKYKWIMVGALSK
mgnify:CR=1 FL=1